MRITIGIIAIRTGLDAAIYRLAKSLGSLAPVLGILVLSMGCSPAVENGSPESQRSRSSRQLPATIGRALDPPAQPSAFAPSLEVGKDQVLLSWIEKIESEDGSSGHRLQFSALRNGIWQSPVTVAQGNNFFANWADIPKVVASTRGTLFAHWLAKTAEDTYAYSIFMARSIDNGNTWESLGALNDDATPTEHGFVSYTTQGDGVRAFWLDGRAMVEEEGSMALRTAYLNDEIHPSEILDHRVCECCSTDSVSVQGLPTVVFRDRSSKEIRDIAVIQALSSHDFAMPAGVLDTSTGSKWSKSVPVHVDGWRIAGCPVNGPELAVSESDVAVAWFTGRDDAPEVSVAFSSNGGKDFDSPFVVDATKPLGRVDVVMVGPGNAVVSWMASDTEGAEIRMQAVTSDGKREPQIVVAKTSASRSAGVPRMVQFREQLYLAWVELESGSVSRLRVREIDLSSLLTS